MERSFPNYFGGLRLQAELQVFLVFFFYFQLGSNALMLLAGNIVGLYYQHMTDIARQTTTARTKHCVESRVKLECEREHQEQLLLSVIPAYIAAEVRSIFECTGYD